MRKNKLIVAILTVLLVVQMSLLFNTTNNAFENRLIRDTINDDTPNPIVLKSIGAGGEEQLKTNVFRNGDFEDVDEYGVPTDIYNNVALDAYQDDAYTGIVYSGSYSGYVSGEGNEQYGTYSEMYRYSQSGSYPYLVDSQILDFYWRVLANPDYSGSIEDSLVDIQIHIYNGLNTYTMMYFLSYENFSGGNTSYNAYFDVRAPDFSWNHFHRNISSDFESVFGSFTSAYRVNSLFLYTYSPIAATGPIECVFDEFSLQDKYTTEYLANGDFEDGTGTSWNINPRGVGSISDTNDCISGNRATNLTVFNKYEDGNAYAEFYYSIGSSGTPPRGYYAYQQNQTVLDFYWKYSDKETAGSHNFAYVQLQFANTSHDLYATWHLGADSGFSINSNSTSAGYSERNFLVDGFGIEGSWQHSIIDVYDVLVPDNLDGLALISVDIFVYTYGDKDSKIELLMDKFQIVSYPSGDPGFEEDHYWSGSNTLNGWFGSNGLPYNDRTTAAHSGNWAANITSFNGAISEYAYREVNYVQISADWYTDFWWRIETLEAGSGGAASYFYLDFEGGFGVYYILGSEGLYNPSNSSNYVYYYVDEYNSQEEWFNLARNLYSDLAFFGPNNYNLTYIQAASFADSMTSVAVTLYDDIHFVRDTQGPEINSITILDTPVYYAPTEIEIVVEEQLGYIQDVDLYYFDGVAPWKLVSAVHQGGDTYLATIPAYDFGQSIQFFITAADNLSLLTIDDNGGLDYSYNVEDNVAPAGYIVTPIHDATLSTDYLIQVDCSDIGSGINRVEIYRETQLIATLTEAPYEYLWNTYSSPNGTYSLIAHIYDNAGNMFEDAITVHIENDYDPPVISSLLVNPDYPEYYEEVTIFVGVEDASGIEEVILHYIIGTGGVWDSMPMVADAALYSATLAPQEWNIEVFFYIVAEDVFGASFSYGSVISPHSYIVEDSVKPIMNLDLPSETETLKGEIVIGMELEDSGSGIDVFEVLLDDELLTDVVADEFIWDTTQYDNGEHTLVFNLLDNAGNIHTQEYTFEVHNLRPSTQGFVNFIKNFGVLIGAIIGGAGIGTFYFLRWRKAKLA